MRRLLVLSILLAGCPRLPPDEEPGTDPGETDTGTDTEPGETGPPFLPANDRAYLPAARELIGEAETRVRLAMFLVQDVDPVSDLLDDLADAAARGVDVDVVLDEEGSGVDEVTAELAAAGIEVSLDDPTVTSHNKLLVVDDQVLLGSHNWTGPAMRYNTEASVQVRSPELADHFAAYVEGTEPEEPAIPGLVPLADGAVVSGLNDCLTRAEARVDLVMYAVAWRSDFPGSSVDRLLLEVERAHARGVAVRVLLDRSDWIEDNGINDEAAERLLAAGVEVRHTPRDDVTHAKVLQCDETVLVSDANWSYSGLERYHGTSVAITETGLAAHYTAWFDALWDDASAWAP